MIRDAVLDEQDDDILKNIPQGHEEVFANSLMDVSDKLVMNDIGRWLK